MGNSYTIFFALSIQTITLRLQISCRITQDVAGIRRNLQAIHEGVSKSFRTGRLERELQMVQLSDTM